MLALAQGLFNTSTLSDSQAESASSDMSKITGTVFIGNMIGIHAPYASRKCIDQIIKPIRATLNYRWCAG